MIAASKHSRVSHVISDHFGVYTNNTMGVQMVPDYVPGMQDKVPYTCARRILWLPILLRASVCHPSPNPKAKVGTLSSGAVSACRFHVSTWRHHLTALAIWDSPRRHVGRSVLFLYKSGGPESERTMSKECRRNYHRPVQRRGLGLSILLRVSARPPYPIRKYGPVQYVQVKARRRSVAVSCLRKL